MKIIFDEIESASKLDELEEIRVKYFGKKGLFTSAIKEAEDKKELNLLKDKAISMLEEKRELCKNREIEERLINEKIDLTLPGRNISLGSRHPVKKMMNEIESTFKKMGFALLEGPEIESTFNNFDALNTPKDHPSRNYSDTFYFDVETVLRTHTTTVQVRALREKKLPIAAISFGKVYRPDYDATHTPMFHQVEGIFLGDASFSNLKALLEEFLIRLFPNVATRIRPHFFPFTEPSAEIDMSCCVEGCRKCKNTGWIEVMGCGMISPEVLKHFGYTLKNAKGFAFGMGVERLAMFKYGVSDLRMLYENDLRLLRQC